MLKEVVASKAAKLIAACVCPVAGTAALTVSVPEVRDAVHRATAPRAKAKPAARRAPARAQAVAVCPQPADTPVVLASAPLAGVSVLPALPTDFASLALPEGGVPFAHFHRFPEGPFASPGRNGDVSLPPPGPPPLIPEPDVWIQLLLGFGVLGGATRSIYRYRKPEEFAAERGG